MPQLEHMFALGQKILLAGRRVLLGRGLGVTLIVHPEKLDPGYRPYAILSTLPTRRHQRALLIDAIAGSALADGATSPAAINAMAAADLTALDEGELDRAPAPVIPLERK